MTCFFSIPFLVSLTLHCRTCCHFVFSVSCSFSCVSQLSLSTDPWRWPTRGSQCYFEGNITQTARIPISFHSLQSRVTHLCDGNGIFVAASSATRLQLQQLLTMHLKDKKHRQIPDNSSCDTIECFRHWKRFLYFRVLLFFFSNEFGKRSIFTTFFTVVVKCCSHLSVERHTESIYCCCPRIDSPSFVFTMQAAVEIHLLLCHSRETFQEEVWRQE